MKLKTGIYNKPKILARFQTIPYHVKQNSSCQTSCSNYNPTIETTIMHKQFYILKSKNQVLEILYTLNIHAPCIQTSWIN